MRIKLTTDEYDDFQQFEYPKPPPMTPERVKATGRQFGQKIGAKEAKAIARVLAPRGKKN